MTVQWSARTLPKMRATLAASAEAAAERLAGQSGRVPLLDRQVSEGVDYHRTMAFRARHADLFWVSGDMAALALDASLDIPGFTGGDLACPNGLAIFGAPLPDLETPPLWLEGGRQWQGSIPVWGVWWHPRDADHFAFDVLTRRDALPTPMMGDGELQAVFSAVVPRDRPLMFDGAEAAWFDSGLFGLDPPQPMKGDMLGIVAFVAAMSHLMMTPTLAERRDLDARTGKPGSEQTRPPDLVSVVDLRPLRYAPAEPKEGTPKWKHRWVVRGHWAQQRYGPGGELRKLIYREPHVKGSPDAPFLAAEKVMVWRR